jgi:hypothetical protein
MMILNNHTFDVPKPSLKPLAMVIQFTFCSDTEGFRSIEDVGMELSCLGKLASVLDKIGDIKARDDTAREFCELERKIQGHTIVD